MSAVAIQLYSTGKFILAILGLFYSNNQINAMLKLTVSFLDMKGEKNSVVSTLALFWLNEISVLKGGPGQIYDHFWSGFTQLTSPLQRCYWHQNEHSLGVNWGYQEFLWHFSSSSHTAIDNFRKS